MSKNCCSEKSSGHSHGHSPRPDQSTDGGPNANHGHSLTEADLYPGETILFEGPLEQLSNRDLLKSFLIGLSLLIVPSIIISPFCYELDPMSWQRLLISALVAITTFAGVLVLVFTCLSQPHSYTLTNYRLLCLDKNGQIVEKSSYDLKHIKSIKELGDNLLVEFAPPTIPYSPKIKFSKSTIDYQSFKEQLTEHSGLQQNQEPVESTDPVLS